MIDGSVSVKLCGLTVMYFGKTELSVHAPAKVARLREAYVWYDYFCVPQIKARSVHQEVGAELQKAVDSIPAYIANSQHFFCLTPSVRHRELPLMCNAGSWATRGWCRVELAARVLSVVDAPVLNILSRTNVVEAMPFGWI